MTTCFKDEALRYAAQGLAVFPVAPREKRPATAHGCKDATCDPSMVEQWWTEQPDANIGIATGSKSGGLIVLDFDVDDEKGKDGLDTLHEWERANGELTETVCSETGGGGMHMLYRTQVQFKNSVNAGLGVDVRGEGGYIVAPPSIHPDGGVYAWINDPDEYEVAEMDGHVERFIDHVLKPRARRERFDRDAEVKHGARNDAMYKFVCSLISASTDRELLYPLALQYNFEKLKPPLDPREVETIVQSAMTRPDGHSAEVRAQESKRPKKPDALLIYKELLKRGACTIDGAPACRVGKWHEIGLNAIDRAIYDIDERATLGVIRDVHHRIMTNAPKLKQSPCNLIGFTNGVLDVDTFEFCDWNDTHVIANVVPCDWNPDAQCPEVDRMLHRMACNDDGVFMALQQVLGACIYRCAVNQMVILVNPGGSNGKSTFIWCCNILAGPENSTSIEFTELGHRFQAGALAGKTVNTSDDVGGFIESAQTGVLKKIITGDRIHTDVKGGDGFDFTPYVTLIVSANEMPRIADTSGGMTRRMFGIPFNAVFKRTDPDYDPHIIEKIDTPEGRQRLAVLACIGLAQLRADNGFTPFAASERMTAEIVEDNDPVRQFMADCDHGLGWFLERDTESAYDAYCNWAEKSGNKAMSRRTFTKRAGTVLGLVLRQKKVQTSTGESVKVRVYSAPECAVKVPSEGI